MKITTFNPMILSPKADELIRFFEELGFEKRHAPTVETGKSMVTSTRMKNADGFCIDIAGVDSLPRDVQIIRMNVDDFEEAYNLTIQAYRLVGASPSVSTDTRRQINTAISAVQTLLSISPVDYNSLSTATENLRAQLRAAGLY